MLSARLISDVAPAAPINRGIRAIVNFQGKDARGGGTVECDVGQGTVLSLFACSVDVEIFNDSDNDPLSTYRVDGAITERAVTPQVAPVLSTREDVAIAAVATGFIRVPSFARAVRVFSDPILNAAALVEQHQTQTPGDLAVCTSLADGAQVMSGCEFVRVTGIAVLAVVRRVVVCFDLGL